MKSEDIHFDSVFVYRAEQENYVFFLSNLDLFKLIAFMDFRNTISYSIVKGSPLYKHKERNDFATLDKIAIFLVSQSVADYLLYY